MGLYERLAKRDDANPKIPVHQFIAAISEMGRGQFARADIITMFSLRTEDEAGLDTLITKVNAMAAGRRFEFGRLLHDMLLLAEEEMAYTTKAAFDTRISAFT